MPSSLFMAKEHLQIKGATLIPDQISMRISLREKVTAQGTVPHK